MSVLPEKTYSRHTPRIGVVVLTMGNRKEELHKALASIRVQKYVDLDVVVVGNGWKPEGLPSNIKTVHVRTNIGIPAARNIGARMVEGDYLLFVDDDAAIPSFLFSIRLVDMFREHPQTGLIQPRITDPSGISTPRRWIPRLRKGQPDESSYVFSVLEAVVMIPRKIFEEIGGWGEPYFYAHEGIELAWRVWNAGYRVWYAGNLSIHHDVTSPTRHSQYYRLNARNRVWLAKRNLPWLLIVPYVLTWTMVQIVRSAQTGGTGFGSWLKGWWQGWSSSPGGRNAMSWRTVARMTRFGRFPIV